MRAIEQRVAKLEQATRGGASLYAWAEADETPEQAIARQYPDGTPEGATVTVLRRSDGR
jgi:hypothetical protein